MSNYLKIGLYGDSLSMARENVITNEDRYIYKLNSFLHERFPNSIIEIIQRSKASITSSEQSYNALHDSVYFNWGGELAIIHIGIVDCSPRPVDKETREKISKLPTVVRKVIVRYLHNNRRRILLKGNANYITTKSVFEKDVLDILDNLLKNYKKIAVINIVPTNKEIEFRSPGLSESILDYNLIIKKCVESKKNPSIQLLDLYNVVKQKGDDNIDKYVVKEDGHHITPLTHNIIFEMLKSLV